MATRMLSDKKLAAIQHNLFPAAHAAIADWHGFEWHRDKKGEPQTDKVHSSQALAIDVFGAVAAAPSGARDAILDALAVHAELEAGGPWQIALEWCDPDNLLREPRQTQVDAIAFGARSIMVIECKFTETGGSCSQTRKLTKGPAKGLRQCTGRYALQAHPVSRVASSCTLSGKGIRYWDVIPRVFALDPQAVHDPCPFRGETFQWMRNMVLADELGRHHGKAARCLIACAAGGGFPTEGKARDWNWLPPIAEAATPPLAISYQDLASLAADVDPAATWNALGRWIDGKVSAVRSGLNGQLPLSSELP